MFHGFYNLTSGILSQNRNLDVISNNMVNVSTPGYKGDKLTMTTFREEMLYRNGNMGKSVPEQLGTTAMIKTPMQTVTRFDQGAYEDTGSIFDFALGSPGFFVVEGEGGPFYTRNGAFTIDEEGFLCLGGVGRVQGENGPIHLNTDRITVDAMGNIYEKELETGGTEGEGNAAAAEEGNAPVAKFRVVDFGDYTQLTRQGDGCFTAAAAPTAVEDANILWKSLERSNVDPVEEMTAMMSSQRTLQSAAQMLKMYDSLMGRIVTEIGKL